MKKIISLLLISALLVLTFAGCTTTSDSTTDTSWDKVKENNELILGLDIEFPPMGYKDTETGEITGFDIDLATEVCSRLGIELKLQPILWDNKELELNGGNIDCIWNGMSYTTERDEQLNLTDAYMTNNQILLTKEDADFSTKDELAGKKLGVQSKSSAETALNKNTELKDSLAEVVPTESYTTALLELENGTIDCIAIDEVVARYYMSTSDTKYKVITDGGEDFSLAAEDYVIAFRKNDTELKNKIYETLQEMKADGKLAEISTKWFTQDITTVK